MASILLTDLETIYAFQTEEARGARLGFSEQANLCSSRCA